MINKKLWILTIIIALFFTISAVSAHYNASSDDISNIEKDELTINTSDYDKQVLISNQDDLLSFDGEKHILGDFNNNTASFTDLADEISNSSDKLILKMNYTYNSSKDSAFVNGIVINKDNFVIDGHGYTINGDYKASIFIITGNNVTLKNIIFINASSSDDGGAVYFNKNGNVINCNFTENIASENGGAVYFNGTALIKDSTFIYNAANKNGGAVYGNDDVIIENSKFYGNEAMNAGAIYINKTGIINHSHLVLNTVPLNGGAVIFNGKGNVDSCNFTANEAGDRSSHGGAILFNDEGIVNNTIFHFNIALGYGGALNFKKNGIVENSVFTKNKAGNSHGAILFRQEGIVKGCNFTNNNATSYCSAVNFELNGTVDSCNFNNNSAVNGAVNFNSGGNINNSNFINNKALVSYGSAVCGMNNLITISNSLFLNNKAQLSYMNYENNYTFRFNGKETLIHALYVQQCSLNNVTYWNGSIVNSDDVTPSPYSFPGIDVTVEVYDSNNTLQDNVTLKTNADSKIYYNPFHLNDGEYAFKVYHLDDNYYFSSQYPTTASFSLKRNSSSVKINITDNEKFLYNECNITFNVINRSEVRVIICDENQSVLLNKTTDEDYVIVDLIPGNYNITVYNEGNEFYVGSNDSKLFIIIKNESDIIQVSNVTKYFKGPERFVVTVMDYKKNPIANKSVQININGRTYNITTDDNGNASIGLNLNSGVYNITTTVNNQTINSTVTILTTVNGTDITKVFRNQTQYYATFLNSQGKYLDNGTMVKFNVNGIIYERQIEGTEGLAKLNINLVQGNYIITAMNTETGENCANNITVLSRITENTNITKYFKNATQYKVKIIGDDGNAVGAGEIVSFNINGIFYNHTTDASGIAQLNINLNPGDYIITAEHKSCRVSNSIKVLPVLTAEDLVKKYGDSDPFIATLVDGQGKAFEGQNIIFNINGVFYNNITDSNGEAKLNIPLIAGEYIITSMYENGAVTSNKITIKS